ncbi:serine O-acetyltransferase [Vibrio breoganii]
MNAIYIYRLSNFCNRYRIPLVGRVCKVLVFLIFNSVVPATAKIGRYSKFAYGGVGVVIHSKSIIGERVIIGQNVTIGRKLDPEGVPTIGDDVYIAAGSRLLGNIRIGNNVIIGANSVVINDIPDNCIVAGAPAKIIREDRRPIYELLKNIY